MTTRPDFSDFHAAIEKCDPEQLAELLLDRPVRTRRTIPESTREAALFLFILAWALFFGWYTHQNGAELRQIRAEVGELLASHARQEELAQLVGSEEAIDLMNADRERAAVVRAIERAP